MAKQPLKRSRRLSSKEKGIEKSDESLASTSKSLGLFEKIANAIGDTLESVCNMQDQERNELITVLRLDEQIKIRRLKNK